MNSLVSGSPTTPLAIPPTPDQNLIYWPALQTDEKAFVAAYIENAYSLPDACRALKMSPGVGAKMLRNVTIRKAVSEMQSALDGIDFLNEAWVKAQLLRLYPMVIGDEPVPYITNTGEEVEGRKFDAATAMRIIEYVAPKATKAPAVNININNVGRLTDEELEKIATSGRIVSEQ